MLGHGAGEPTRRSGARQQGAQPRRAPGRIRSASPRIHIFNALEDSLRRLRTDYIDLYQIHSFDPLTSFEEVLSALDDAVRQGKVRYIGCSNLAAWQVTKALGISALRQPRAVRVGAGVLLPRRARPGTRAAADDHRSAAGDSPSGARSPAGSCPASSRDTAPPRRMPAAPRSTSRRSTSSERTTIIDVMIEIGERHDVSAAQVALAWIARPARRHERRRRSTPARSARRQPGGRGTVLALSTRAG